MKNMKPLNAIAVIIAVIALIGDLFLMATVLVTAGEAANAITTEFAGSAELTQLGQTFGFIINIGWAWAIAVLITCIFVLKFTLLDPRKKK